MVLVAVLVPIAIVSAVRTQVPTGIALAVTIGLTWATAALVHAGRGGISDGVVFFFVLPHAVCIVATICSIVTVGRPKQRQAILASLAGYALGLAIRALLPACYGICDIAAPAVYAASAAVWACAT